MSNHPAAWKSGSSIARLPLAILLLLSFLAVPPLCAAEEASGFLLRQRFRIVVASEGVDATIERIIFRDGLIVTVSLTADQTFIRRRRASPEALSRLHAAFRRYRIGSQVGQCLSGTTPFDFFSETTTYFTKGSKGHTFRTGDQFSRPCGHFLQRILSELSDFVNTAPAEPGLQDVLVPN